MSQIRVSISTLHDFLSAQRRKDAKLKRQQAEEQNSPDLNEATKRLASINEDISDMNDVRRRIDTLKKRTMPKTQTNAPCYSYDPTQPLHLLPKSKKDLCEE